MKTSTHTIDSDSVKNLDKEEIGVDIVSCNVGTGNALKLAWTIITNNIAVIRNNSMFESLLLFDGT